MSDARDTVFKNLRAALSTGGADPAERRRIAAQRIGAPPAGILPSRVEGKSPAELVALFKSYADAVKADVIEVASDADVPAAIARFLRETNRPLRVRMGRDPYLAGLDWSKEPALERRSGAAAPDDEVGLTHAVAGIAETGTLVLASGPDNPVTIDFLPETHIVVLEAGDVASGFEDAFRRAGAGAGAMPRTLNLVTGPSRTGDIGGRIVLGAHGPRRLAIVLVGGASATHGAAK